MSDDIVELIDRAVYDYATSPDAMRWAPDQVADDERPVVRSWNVTLGGVSLAGPNYQIGNSVLRAALYTAPYRFWPWAEGGVPDWDDASSPIFAALIAEWWPWIAQARQHLIDSARASVYTSAGDHLQFVGWLAEPLQPAPSWFVGNGFTL